MRTLYEYTIDHYTKKLQFSARKENTQYYAGTVIDFIIMSGITMFDICIATTHHLYPIIEKVYRKDFFLDKLTDYAFRRNIGQANPDEIQLFLQKIKVADNINETINNSNDPIFANDFINEIT